MDRLAGFPGASAGLMPRGGETSSVCTLCEVCLQHSVQLFLCTNVSLVLPCGVFT